MNDRVYTERLEEHPVPGKPLGRHVEHDELSREHAYAEEFSFNSLRDVMHLRHGSAFNQGDVGSCTGNAMAGAINTEPLHEMQKIMREPDAVLLYSLATTLDGFPGIYPPDDTGSSGLAVAKAAKQLKYIAGYKHAFNISQALSALQVGPTITGIAWYEGFDDPDPTTGLVEISGQIRGGHEIEEVGFVVKHTMDESLIILENSWGLGWGAKIGGVRGRFCMTVKTKKELMAQQGDTTILVKI